MSGTRDSDRTGYCSLLLVFPLKMILESISTFLKRIIVAIRFLRLNPVLPQKVIREMTKVMNKIMAGRVRSEKGAVENEKVVVLKKGM